MSSAHSLLRLLASRVVIPAPPDDAPVIDWRPARAAVRSLLAWACDVARTHAPEDDDRDSIDRVQCYVAALLAGQRACCLPADFTPSELDLLVTASTLIDAFSLDLGAGAVAIGDVIAGAYAAHDRRTTSEASTTPRGSLADLARLLGWAPRGPRVAHGLDDEPANDNAARAPRIGEGR